MAFVIGRGFLDIDLDDKKAISGLGKLEGKLNRWATTAARYALRIGTVVGTALVGAVAYSVKQAADQEKAERRLASVLTATGGAAELSAREMYQYASELQRVTGIGDDVIINAEAIIATFKNIKGDVFKDTVEAALDMSEVLGTDLKASALQLGKALNDPATQMTALQRSGVSFTESQKEQIKVLSKSGKLAEAQAIILKELKSEFGGAAREAGNTFAGSINKAREALGDMAEVFGKEVIPNLQLAADQLTLFFQNSSADAKTWGEYMGTAIGTVSYALQDLIDIAAKGPSVFLQEFARSAIRLQLLPVKLLNKLLPGLPGIGALPGVTEAVLDSIMGPDLGGQAPEQQPFSLPPAPKFKGAGGGGGDEMAKDQAKKFSAAFISLDRAFEALSTTDPVKIAEKQLGVQEQMLDLSRGNLNEQIRQNTIMEELVTGVRDIPAKLKDLGAL